MPTFERPTVSLHYEDSGAGEPAIVFLHGWCDDAAGWAATAADFSETHRCIVPEMRGHGRSGMPRDHGYFPEALAGDVVALCGHLGVEHPVLVGHSFGGFLAASIAHRHPSFARAVVVEDQPLDLRGFHAQMLAIESVVRDPEAHVAFREQFLDSLVSPAMPPADRDLLNASSRATPVEVGQALWAPLFEFTSDEIAERSDQLMAALSRQPSLTVEAAPQQAYHAALGLLAPSVGTAVIPSGHWIHLEHPAEFRAALREFLSRL
ncbi:MAG: alpha/beta hydrolase [Dehalococcoidia bacterium]